MSIQVLVATGLEANLPSEGLNGKPYLTRDTRRLLFGAGAGAQLVPLNVRLEDVIGLLGGGNKIDPNLIPPVAVHNAVAAASIAERDELLADGRVQKGDLVVVADNGEGRRQSYVLLEDGQTWVESGGDGAVHSVQGKVGQVVLTTDDIREGETRLYFSEARVGQYIAGVINKAGGVAGVNAQGYLSLQVIPPNIVRAGDDATRLAAGTVDNPVEAGALLAAAGDGTTEWTTVIDGGQF